MSRLHQSILYFVIPATIVGFGLVSVWLFIAVTALCWSPAWSSGDRTHRSAGGFAASGARSIAVEH
jgi:hypothetical protein